ncbi:1-aminocyclopropane-1-carboxylate oxidase homolog 1-like [Ipomoea triloba]|uniref:1-aminocyclopropane-1-carboxylate oxidase homolog 1-like n=1 Tax=Ipomoea triloba TaxID=35885 RepID=UPI00125E6DFD|nr:1-aminocyclopropane-1-carboxylate oxidase homolog 1-like [Ipomoea triloba]
MATASTGGKAEAFSGGYDRKSELKAFDDMKTGVKGLVDSGITKLPRIFIHEQKKKEESEKLKPASTFKVPIIDMEGVHTDPTRRSEIIKEIRDACQTWGFFQILNHGIPTQVLDEMIEGVREFHEQDSEVKKQFYSRDPTRKVGFNTNFDFHTSPAATWRDTFYSIMAPHPPTPEELPQVCRDILIKYTNSVQKLGLCLLELFSEALGLDKNYLEKLGCAVGLSIFGQYYPACPEPELTFAIRDHSDSGFFTVLIQDPHIGGLQLFHENQWVDLPPLHGALVVNVADLLQLITNDKFKSALHRVIAQKIGPRVSVASFFRTRLGDVDAKKVYGPIKELVSDENPPVYRETTTEEYLMHFYKKGLDGTSGLLKFRLQKEDN